MSRSKYLENGRERGRRVRDIRPVDSPLGVLPSSALPLFAVEGSIDDVKCQVDVHMIRGLTTVQGCFRDAQQQLERFSAIGLEPSCLWMLSVTLRTMRPSAVQLDKKRGSHRSDSV